MKKILGYIFITIPIINVLGRIAAASGNRTIPISPMGIIILIMMFFGGITLLSSSKKKNEEEPKKDELVKTDDN